MKIQIQIVSKTMVLITSFQVTVKRRLVGPDSFLLSTKFHWTTATLSICIWKHFLHFYSLQFFPQCFLTILASQELKLVPAFYFKINSVFNVTYVNINYYFVCANLNHIFFNYQLKIFLNVWYWIWSTK